MGLRFLPSAEILKATTHPHDNMKGFHYLVDDKGERLAAQIDLRTHGALWHEFLAFAEAREKYFRAQPEAPQAEPQAEPEARQSTPPPRDEKGPEAQKSAEGGPEAEILRKIKDLQEKQQFATMKKELSQLLEEEERREREEEERRRRAGL